MRLTPATGIEQWKYFPGHFIALATPAVVDGLVYAVDGIGQIFAVHADTGGLAWTYQAGCCGSGVNLTGPVVVNGVLYVLLSNMILYALDASTGGLLWQTTTGPVLFHSTASATVANGTIYVGSNSEAQAYAASDGSVLWDTPLPDTGTQSPILANGVVYIPGGQGGTFWALDAQSGDQRWSFTAGNSVAEAPTSWQMGESSSVRWMASSIPSGFPASNSDPAPEAGGG